SSIDNQWKLTLAEYVMPACQVAGATLYATIVLCEVYDRLSSEVGEGLVRSTPIVAHAYPPGFRTLNPHAGHVTSATHIHHVHEQPVTVPLEAESKPTHAHAWHSVLPTVHDGHDAGFPLRDLHEGGLGHVEVGTWWVAPAAVVRVLRPIGRAQVCGRHSCYGRPIEAPLRVDTLYLEALSTCEAVVEKNRAKSRRVSPVPVVEQVPVTTRSPYTQCYL
ncbi:glycosyltransferase, partial [Striga asiatica]